MNERILVTGANGQLGNEMRCLAEGANADCFVFTDVAELDITDLQSVRRCMSEHRISVVVNCAAYTNVDKAEDEPEICTKVNAQGTENIAKVCKELELPMMYISTDYVFGGEGERPWEPDDKREPLNVYGETKYQGELAVERWLEKYFIVRIAWVFGSNGKNFINTMLRIGKENFYS